MSSRKFKFFHLATESNHLCQAYAQIKPHIYSIPMLIVHGEPGGSFNQKWAELLRQRDWNIIGLDQRGCGKSMPYGSIENNSPDLLIEDMENLRSFLGFEQWALFGGSWGTTLSLLYAIKYPQRVKALLLRGIWLARDQDIDAFLVQSKAYQPDKWRKLSELISQLTGKPKPQTWRQISSLAYSVFSRHDQSSNILAQAWENYESSLSSLKIMPVDPNPKPNPALALLECSFIKNHLPPKNDILSSISAGILNHIPTTIIHGRHDHVCPPYQAYDLSLLMPHATLTIVESAGHSTFDFGMRKAIRKASKKLRKQTQ